MEFRLPELGEGVYEGEFISWMVEVGETVKSGQSLMEVMTDKATMEVPSPFAGTITELKIEPGQQVKVGDVVLSYKSGNGQEEKEPVAAAAMAPSRSATATAGRSRANHARTSLKVQAAPSVRQMARKMGVDLTTVSGTGPSGRILIEDLTQHVQRFTALTAPPQPEKRPPLFDFGRPGDRIKLQGMRGQIAEAMVRSKTTIPHYSYVDECDVSDLVGLRTSLKDRFAESGVKLTYLPFFVKAVTRALKEVAIVNATMDEEKQEVTLHEQYNLGIAVATSRGLMVPVIHNADQKDIIEIAREIERLSKAAHAQKLKVEDLRNGTFTLTSIGSIGGLISSPVINHPEVGILGIGKMVRRPVYDEHDNVVPATLVYLSLSFDHRVVDGAVGAEFTNRVIHHLSAPAALLLPETI